MLALFALSMLSFLLLFAAVLRLLLDAKRKGARLARKGDPGQTVPSHAHGPQASFSARRRPQEVQHLAEALLTEDSLSKLVPGKQPDWRFMVRERAGRVQRTVDLGAAHVTERHPERSDWTYYNENMGDLSDPYAPSRAGMETRRAG